MTQRNLQGPRRRARRPLAVAAVAAVLLASCGDDESASSSDTGSADTGQTAGTVDGELLPPVPITVTGTGSAPAAAGDEKVAEGAATDMSIQPFAGFLYEVGDGLPALPTDATGYQYPVGADVDEATVAELAAALGVPGTPVRVDDPATYVLWQVGPDDGTAPSLVINLDPQLSWYSSAAWATQPAAEPCVATDDDTAVECPEATPPEGVLTADEAEARTADILRSLGEDPSAFTFETYADDWFASVVATTRLGGVTSPMSWSFGFGADGVLQYSSGSLATPQPVGPYPLIDLDTALARLADQQQVWAGGVQMDAPVAATDSSSGTAETVPSPEPETAVLVDVVADLWWVTDAEGSVWLLPAYRFTDTEDRIHVVPAVTDEIMVIDESLTGGTSGVSEPGVVTGEPVPEPVDPAVTVDPAAIVGLPVDEATAVLERQGLSLRVVRRDGEDLAVTADFVDTRVNVAVETGADGTEAVTEIVSVG